MDISLKVMGSKDTKHNNKDLIIPNKNFGTISFLKKELNFITTSQSILSNDEIKKFSENFNKC